MVALLLSMLLAVALLMIQGKLWQQTTRGTDVAVRDTQTRAAMDLITQDISSGGFLFGGTQNFCNALLTYNSAASGYFVHHPVDAVDATAGGTLKFAPTLVLNYPAAGSNVTSDVLVVKASTASTNFNDAKYPIAIVSPNALYTPSTTGTLAVASTLNAAATGDVGILQAPVGGKRACLRVPMTMTGLVVASTGALMPSSFYAGFSAQLAGAGYTDTLSDAEIFQGRMVDMGAKTAPLQTSIVYYVDGSGTFPVLMRATYSLLDDTLIGTPQSIAAGVVAVKVLFGVDPGNTGAVTDYKTAAEVTSSLYWDFVRSVKVALLTRTVNDDPDASYHGPTSVALGTSFPSLTVPASSHRFLVQSTEVATRNFLWR